MICWIYSGFVMEMRVYCDLVITMISYGPSSHSVFQSCLLSAVCCFFPPPFATSSNDCCIHAIDDYSFSTTITSHLRAVYAWCSVSLSTVIRASPYHGVYLFHRFIVQTRRGYGEYICETSPYIIHDQSTTSAARSAQATVASLGRKL